MYVRITHTHFDPPRAADVRAHRAGPGVRAAALNPGPPPGRHAGCRHHGHAHRDADHALTRTPAASGRQIARSDARDFPGRRHATRLSAGRA